MNMDLKKVLKLSKNGRKRIVALTERERIIKEIQAFASEYAHPITRRGVSRDVVIVEQLIDFLTPVRNPEPPEASL
jgi:hypothetical protein